MNLIIDANIIFSALIKDGKSAELIFYPYLKLFTPKFVLEELNKHKIEILEKTKRMNEEFDNLLSNLLEIITVIPKSEIESYLTQASAVSPDPDDIPYFALALKLNCPIWSNDKKLKEQNIIKIYSTEDIVELIKEEYI